MRTTLALLAALAISILVAPALHAQQCDDGSACTTNDMCSDGMCSGTAAAGGGCDDFNECTVNDRCQNDPVAGIICMGDNGTAGMPCQSGCGTCEQPVPLPGVPLICVGSAEDNGEACDFNFNCLTGRCTTFGVPIPDVPTVILCIPEQVTCPDTDGNLCTDNCNPSTNQCEREITRCVPTCETCNASTGQCEPANIGRTCDDFNVCSGQSRCEVLDIPTGDRGLCMAGVPTPGPDGCTGDCNDDGMVVVNEMVLGVNITLGNTPLSQCEAFDTNDSGSAEVNELIAGVNGLLNGCA